MVYRRRGKVRSPPRRARVQQSVNMDHEIAHMGIVDRSLRGRAPRGVGFIVVRIDANNVEFRSIPEFDAIRRHHLAAKDKVEQLL